MSGLMIFCVLSAGSGGIDIANYVHIAVYTSLIGAGRISLGNYCNLSSRVSIYSSSDDYSGMTMTNPMVPSQYTNVTHAPVMLGKHVIVGSGAVILPGVTLEDGVAIGALSLVRKWSRHSASTQVSRCGCLESVDASCSVSKKLLTSKA